MYKGIKKLAELILESEEKFLTGQDEQEICLGSLLKSGAQDEIWVSEDGEYHTVMIGNKEEQDNSMQVCHESEHPVCLPKLLWIANALQKLLEQANGNLPIEKNENPENNEILAVSKEPEMSKEQAEEQAERQHPDPLHDPPCKSIWLTVSINAASTGRLNVSRESFPKNSTCPAMAEYPASRQRFAVKSAR